MLASQVVLIAYAAWLTERFGLPLGVNAALAIALGIGELAAAAGTIAFSDRVGQLRSARYGLAVMCLSSAALAVSEGTLMLGVAALFGLLFGFEFAPDIDQARRRRDGFVQRWLRRSEATRSVSPRAQAS